MQNVVVAKPYQFVPPVRLRFWPAVFRPLLRPMLALTLLAACFLMVGGIFKIVAALCYRFGAWGWPLASGIIDLILGVMIWQGWPASGLWVLGAFLGLNLVFRGINWIALGLALRAVPRPTTT
jgi:uncharacterized membrane protein HdeD (DUF308 family)